MAKVMLVGAGNIGSTLYSRLREFGHKVLFVVRSGGIYKDLTKRNQLKGRNLFDCYDEVDIVCLAIPTADNGVVALDYLLGALGRGKPVVTCEKGALSNFFSVLEDWLPNTGYSATVGGGTRLLDYARDRVGPDTQEIHAVLNGTLNFIFDEISRGRSLGEVVAEAKKLGYAEPGAENPIDILNMEACRDVPMKAAIVFNILGLGNISAFNIESRPLDEAGLKQLLREAHKRRFIVSITRDSDLEPDVIGGFRVENNGWVISAGFKNTHANPLFARLVLGGVNNALLIHEGRDGVDGTYVVSGQGAGAFPTTKAMLIDVQRLLKSNSSKRRVRK